MITISLSVLMVIYAVLLLLFIGIFFLNVWHLIISASLTLKSLLVCGFILLITGVVLSVTWSSIQPISWQESITIFNTAWFAPPSSF